MVGILSRLKGYRVKSNRESGNGRSDIVMYAANGRENKAVIGVCIVFYYGDCFGICGFSRSGFTNSTVHGYAILAYTGIQTMLDIFHKIVR